MPDHGWFLCSSRRSLSSPRRGLKITNDFFFSAICVGFPRVKGHANPHQPEYNAELQTLSTVLLRHKTSKCCKWVVWRKKLPVADANGFNNTSLTLSHLEVPTKLWAWYHFSPPPLPTILNLTLSDRYMPTLFWLSGEPVGSIEDRVHPLNNKSRQSMRAMSKQVMLQTKDSFDNIGTPPGGQSTKRANGSKPTFAKTITS